MHPKKLSSKSMDMTTGSTWNLLLSFAVPLLIGNLFQQLYNTVDSLVVGNFVGTEALAAVGSTTSIINTMVMFFNGTSIGASVIISRHYGAHDDKKLHLAVETTIMVTFLASILFTALGIFLAPPPHAPVHVHARRRPGVSLGVSPDLFFRYRRPAGL